MANDLYEKIIQIFKRKTPPEKDEYIKVLDKINEVLNNENINIRPKNKHSISGGLLYLKKDIPTIIIPDLHARTDFFLSVMLHEPFDETSVLEKLTEDKIQVICVGDGFHGELRAAQRWQLAFNEYKNDFDEHANIDQEMNESLGIMEMVMETKIRFPDNFHFLKGNHENILNEDGNGNYPFRKYSFEGQIVLKYMEKFYGSDFLLKYEEFEKNLPLFAIGKDFLISHAEPQTLYKEKEIIDYKNNSDLIKDFTWTDNDYAEKDSVKRMLEHYLKGNDQEKTFYFGGHRPVTGLYETRAGGKYVQIHNPNKFIVVLIKNDKDINIDEDVIELEDKTKEIK